MTEYNNNLNNDTSMLFEISGEINLDIIRETDVIYTNNFRRKMSIYDIQIDDVLNCINSIQIRQGESIFCRNNNTFARIVQDNNKYILIDLYQKE